MILKSTEASKYIGVSINTIKTLANNGKLKEIIDAIVMFIILIAIGFCGMMLAIEYGGLEKRCDDTKFYLDLIRAKRESPNATIIIQPVRNCECKGGK